MNKVIESDYLIIHNQLYLLKMRGKYLIRTDNVCILKVEILNIEERVQYVFMFLVSHETIF